MKKINMHGRAFLLILVYGILFMLPMTLNQYILDYTFNFALAQLTLALFLLMYDFDTFTNQFNSLHAKLGKQALLFLLSCSVFAFLFLIHYTGTLEFTFLFTKASSVPMLLVIMERFSIYFCLHLNEFYLFHTLHSLLPEKLEHKHASLITFALFVGFHLLLILPYGMNDVIAQLIYYLVVGAVLTILNYTRHSYFIYVSAAFIMLMLFSLV